MLPLLMLICSTRSLTSFSFCVRTGEYFLCHRCLGIRHRWLSVSRSRFSSLSEFVSIKGFLYILPTSRSSNRTDSSIRSVGTFRFFKLQAVNHDVSCDFASWDALLFNANKLAKTSRVARFLPFKILKAVNFAHGVVQNNCN